MAAFFVRTIPEGRGIALVAAVVWVIACKPPEEISKGRSPAPPLEAPRRERIVSLSPASSQFLLALGAGAAIVGVDRESSRIPALSALPVVDLADAASAAANLILLPGTPAGEDPRAEKLRSVGYEVIVYQPHDFEEALALCRGLGARLVGEPRARAFEIVLSRPLAAIGGASFGRPRPRVAGVVGSAPVEFAGGHSFITDLIQIAGGSSVTHGGAETTLPMRAEQVMALAPDLLLIVTPGELTERERKAFQRALPAGYRVAFFAFDAEQRWMVDAVDAARRLRAVIQPLSDELERTTLRHASPTKGGEGGG